MTDDSNDAVLDDETRAFADELTKEIEENPPLKCQVTFNWSGNAVGCIRFSRHGLKRIAPPRTVPDSRSPVLNVGA